MGVWLQIGRFQIEHEVGLNVWDVRFASRADHPWREPLVAEGWATTASWDVKTWRADRATTRFSAVAITDREPERRRVQHVALRVPRETLRARRPDEHAADLQPAVPARSAEHLRQRSTTAINRA